MTAGPNTPRPKASNPWPTFGSNPGDVPQVGDDHVHRDEAEDRLDPSPTSVAPPGLSKRVSRFEALRRPTIGSAYSSFPIRTLPPEQAGSIVGVADEVNLAQVFELLRKNAGRILAVAFLTLGAVMAWTSRSHMQFSATSRLFLGELSSDHRAGQELDLGGGDNGDLGSEMEILRSRSQVKQAILASGFNVDVGELGWEPARYWAWRVSERDIALMDGSLAELKAVNAEAAHEDYRVVFSTPDEYRIWQDDRELGVGHLGQAATFEGLKITLQPGHEGPPRVGKEYQLRILPVGDVADDVMDALEVWSPKAAAGSEVVKVVTLDFVARSPTHAAAFLDALMAGYLSQRQSWKSEEATAVEKFVTAQLQATRESLDSIQAELANYRSDHPVVVLSAEADSMIAQVSRYEDQRVALTLDIAALRDVQRALRTSSSVEAYMLGETKDTVLAGMAATLSQARVRLSELETRFNAEAPDVVQQRSQVTSQLKSIENYVNNRLARAEQNLGSLGGVIGRYEQKLKTVPSAEAGLAQLKREAEVFSSTYSYLLKRQQETAIQKASTVSKNRVLDVAEASIYETSPTLPLRLASFPLGLLIGAAVVMFRSMVSGRLESERDVRRVIGNYPIVASVPRRTRGGSGAKKASFDLLGSGSNFDYVEAFRLLRTNLYDSSSDDQGRIFLFTSPSPGDGKTTCTLSLAAMLAADHKSVMVVDSDFRKQSHRKLFGATAATEADQHDLQGVLLGATFWQQAVRRVPVTGGHFDAIDAGGGAPVELLSSERMLNFLNEARKQYDYVLLDSPSYPLVSDALVLATAADCVLSVVRLDHTPEKLAIEHIRRLSSAAGGFAVIVNNVQQQSLRYGNDYQRKRAG